MEALMPDRRAFSVVGIFDSAPLLMKAIPEIKAKVTAHLEAYTPYPIEGIGKLLGLRKSPIGGMVLVMGVIGAIAGIGFELWTSGWDYPLMTAGKPYLSWEAFIPIMFEVTVLFATFTAGLGMLLLLNRLPLFRHPMLRSKSMPLITRDKYALAVEAGGAELDIDSVSRMLKEAGAESVETIEQPEPAGLIPPKLMINVLGAIVISCFLAGFLTYWATKLFPVTAPMVHMLDQPRLDPQRADSFFKDGFGMRMPVPETVPQDSMPYMIRNQDYAADLVNPLPRSEDVLNRGRQAFNSYCAVCHGILGDGTPSLTAAYGAKPANLVAQKIIDFPDGRIYHVIVTGKNAMPSYSADLDANERWAAIHYVRVLQRALNAKDEDIPK
jgi:mono/diheme cytochrome c family protein